MRPCDPTGQHPEKTSEPVPSLEWGIVFQVSALATFRRKIRFLAFGNFATL
jgi:hypothetical protein